MNTRSQTARRFSRTCLTVVLSRGRTPGVCVDCARARPLAEFDWLSYLANTGTHPPGNSNPVIQHRLLTFYFRVIAPLAYGRMGVVRPGTWIFGDSVARGRAP